MSTGLRINNPDGTQFIFNERSCPAVIIWAGNIDRDSPGYARYEQYARQWTCPNRIPDGYDYVVVGHNMAGVLYRIENSQFTPSGTFERQWTINNGYLNFNGSAKLQDYLMIIAWPGVNYRSGRAGIRVYGNSIFSSITDTSILSYVVFKGETVIEGDWRPSNISSQFNMNNCLCFFYPESNHATVELYNSFDDRDRYPFDSDIADYVYRAIDINTLQRTSLRCKVVVFGPRNLNIETANQRFGLKIRNAKGDVTFSNGIGIMVNPKVFTVKDIGIEAPVSMLGISRPMFMPAYVGGGYRYPYLYHYGLKTSGDSVRVGIVSAKHQPASHGAETYYITSRPLLFLDAADYFNF
ncbi:hypothetical protein [Serratia fonticola]|uniref:hypothetical protein n=1 Tax=Serratia fonticola TaxID=47917 RepID=UPI0034C655DA